MERLRLAFNNGDAVEPFYEQSRSNKRAEDDSREDGALEPKRKKKKKKNREDQEKFADEEHVNLSLSSGLSGSLEIQETATGKKKRRKRHKHVDQAFTTQGAELDLSGIPSCDEGAVEQQGQTVTPQPMITHTGNSLDDEAYMQLNNNDDILRAFQDLDLPRLAGVLRNLDLPSAGVDLNTGDSPFAALLASSGLHDDFLENPVSVTSTPASTSNIAPKPRKSASARPSKSSHDPKPNPNLAAIGPSIASDAHTKLLASKWLNSKKLQELKKSEGLVWKVGKFSAIEAHALKTCLDNYRMSHALSHDELVEVIFSKRKEEHARFWSEIATCVPARPILGVYHYVQRKYDPRKGQGKWEAEEDMLLAQGVTELGQAWSKIAGRVGRTASDCRDRWRNHVSVRDTKLYGEWSKEEENELTSLVMELIGEKGKDTDSDIYWSEISKRMGGRRSRQQCRIKWTDSLHATVKNSGEIARWSKIDASILVHKVAALNVRDDSEIDWKQLPDHDWNLHSAHNLQRRWRTLVYAIKDHEQMPFQEIMEVLLQKHGHVGYTITKPQKKHAHSAKEPKSAEIIEEEDDAPEHTPEGVNPDSTEPAAQDDSDRAVDSD